MNRFGLLITVLATSALINLGCDEASKPLDETPAKKPDKPEPASKPTTQSIISEERQTLPLQVIPFKIEAPKNWKIVTHEAVSVSKSITVLEGRVVDSDLFIQFSGPYQFSAQQVKLLREKAEKETADIRAKGGECIIRESNNLIVIDKRKMPKATTVPSELPPTVEWRMFLFVPSGIAYEQYEINCFELTPDAYQKNEKFLTDIFSTVKYDDMLISSPPPRL